MSWDESLHYAHQLKGFHPWTGYTIDVVALQHTLKEARHDIQVARELTQERTKQHITHLKVIASLPVWKSCLATPEMSPRGWGMTQQTDPLFMQEQLRDLQITEPAFPHHPALLGNRPETTDPDQYDSTWEDVEDDEGDATSQMDVNLDASIGEETDTSLHLHCSLSADRCRWKNHALHRECNCAQQEFSKPQNCWLSFPLFRENTKEDAISNRDWRSEVEEALERGHNAAKVKEVMFASLGRLRQVSKISEYRNGRCFNCQKEGHHWHQCKEPLSPELQELADKMDQECKECEKKALNPQGGPGVKGGSVPTPSVGANSVLPQVARTQAQ